MSESRRCTRRPPSAALLALAALCVTSATAAAQVVPPGRDADKQEQGRRKRQDERRPRADDALRGVDRSAVPPKGDVEMPRGLRARLDSRYAGVTMTAQEKTILKTLDSTITILL